MEQLHKSKRKVKKIINLIISWRKVKQCLKTCKCENDENFTGACFSQGFIEFDYCTAKCMMTTFDFKFMCDKFSKSQCRQECKISDCEANCPVPETKQGICAKDGFLYPSECSLKCRSPDTEIRWKCKSPFSFKKCGRKCKHAVMSVFDDHHHDERNMYTHRQWDHHADYDNSECSNDCDGDMDDHHDHSHTHMTERTVIAYPSYDPHRIYAHLNSNGKKLREVHGLLKHNHEHNIYQDKLLEEQNDMIHQGLIMQKQDEFRDHVQNDKMNRAYLQRLDLRNSIEDNQNLLLDVRGGQTVTQLNQVMINHNVKHMKKKLNRVNKGVNTNSHSLDHLHMKANMQNNAMKAHDKKLDRHMYEHRIHDKKLDLLKDMHLEHDMKQTQMMGEVLKNQGKLGELQDGQMSTQEMIRDHDDNLKNHDLNMKNFVSDQIMFNGVIAEAMDNGQAHMEMEQEHMNKENNHMKNQNLHMKMEAIHMADADDHFAEGHHHHHHHNHHYGHRHHGHHHHKHSNESSLLVGSKI